MLYNRGFPYPIYLTRVYNYNVFISNSTILCCNGYENDDIVTICFSFMGEHTERPDTPLESPLKCLNINVLFIIH